MYAKGKKHGYLGFTASCLAVYLGYRALMQSSSQEIIQLFADTSHHHVRELTVKHAEGALLGHLLSLGLSLPWSLCLRLCLSRSLPLGLCLCLRG